MFLIETLLHKILNHYNRTIKQMSLLIDKTYINGEWVSAETKKTYEIFNPANGNVVGIVPDMDVQDAEKAIQAAYKAFETWKETTAVQRSTFLRTWYNLLEKNKNEISKIMTAESGKPISESLGEISYGNGYIQWYSEQARNIRGEIIPSSSRSKKILVDRLPIGVVATITPWNFPHGMISRKVSPALAVGCTCIIRPAQNTPLTALALVKLSEEAGIPKGVINIITSRKSSIIGKFLCENPLVAGISFTGSTNVGKIIYKHCSVGIKRLALELGGNAPFIVYNSANIDKAVAGGMASKFRNCGQTCVAANRFLIQEEVFDEFVCKLVKKVKALKVGNGAEPGVQIGPLIHKRQMDKVTELVSDACTKGAEILTGGKPLPNLGKLFYEPTVMINVTKGMTIYTEEIFGPIVSIIKFKTEEESINIANNTNVGLAGYFYSGDVKQIFRVASLMETGMIGINEGSISAVEAPFGGIKESGLGREGSHHGTEEYTYLKYICLGGLK